MYQRDIKYDLRWNNYVIETDECLNLYKIYLKK